MTVVPYVSQLDNAPRGNDCGPACVAMMAGVVHPDVATAQTVTELSTQYDRPQDGTTPRDVVAMAAALGVELEVTQAARYPCVALVDYRLLPVRWQTGGDFAHWIVRLSDTVYHDPLGRGTWGANRVATKEQLDAAELAARRWIASVPVPVRVAFKADNNDDMATQPQTKGKARIKSGPWRVRSAANNGSASVTGAAFATGQEFDVLSVVTGAGYAWGVVSMSAGGAALKTADAKADFVGYVRRDGWEWVTTTTPPVVVVPPVNATAGDFVLGINALQNTALLFEEFTRGCKYGMVMNDFQGAANLKTAFPDRTVIARRYFPQQFFMTDKQLIDGLDGMTAQMTYMGYNEADQGGQDGAALRERLAQDVRLAEHMKRIHGANYRPDKAFYIGGTFSMGTPEWFNEPQATENARIVREVFAPAYNAGLIGLDLHLYIQNPAQIDKPNEWRYFSRRWESWFERAGLDPNVRNVHCTETGLDQGGIGGFPAHGSTLEYFRDWCRKYIALQRAPLVVGGKSYRSPIRGGAIFQLGGNGDPRWQGYNIASYLPVLREFYAA